MSTKKLQIIGNFLEVDSTLTQTGKAADAKATGDALNNMQTRIDEVAGLVGGSDDKYYTEIEIDGMIADLNASIDSKVDAVEGKGLSTNDYTTSEKDKLATVEANANFYEHPTHTSYDLGLYKVTVDGSGHVSGATLASKEDIVALGIPAENTKYDTEISDLSDRIDDVEDGINTTNQTLSGVSQELESYKTTNNEAVSTNASGIEVNKSAIEEIKGDYLKSTDKTQLQDDISKVSEKATANASAIEVLNGEGDGSVKQSIDNALNEFAANVTNQFTEIDTTINNHVTNTNNPHGVTKEQLGLDKVENTSDAEKPISDAAQVALDGKADLKHDHEIGEINNLQNLLDELQVNIDTNTTAIDEKADVEHNHDDLYYDKDEILGLITVEEIDDICGSTQMPDVEVDLITMASKDWVQNNYQLKGDYLTETDVSEYINIHNVATDSHNDIRLLIEDLSKDLHTLANSDDETLDQMSEVVEYIKNNSSLIEGITTKKVNISDIVDNLATNVSNKPLSAAQGVALKTLIDTLDSSDVSAVSYQAQSLTEEQKAQARENIGVGTSDIEISSDLTLSGVAAEAKAVGDALNNATQVERFSVQLGPNGTIGGYKTGDIIEEGTDIRVILNKLLQKVVPATYTKPTISLFNNGGTASGNVEAGSSVTPKLRASFAKNDSGGLTSIKIMQGGAAIANGTTTPLDYTGSSIVIGDNTITFTASADYSDAPVKNNNLGEESRENWFAGSTVTSSSYSITGKRQLFYGAGTGVLPTITSDIIRGLSGKKLAPANGNSFNINVAVGQQYIVIAYPKSLRDINNITYVEANDSGMAANFTKTEIQVADARGGTNGLADYKVYTYAMAVPAAAAMTFKVTI